MIAWFLYLFFVFLIGLCVGSFLNVVILRSFTGESIILPPSKCPECHEKIKWYDNIPVLSYFLLKGKCRFCSKKISIQYPIVEFITGVVFLFVATHYFTLPYGISLMGVFLLILACLAIVITVTDIKEQVVFDRHTVSFIVIAIIFNFFNGNIINSLTGMVFSALIMEVLAWSCYIFIKKRSFGLGDTFIAAGIGALVGIKYFVVVLILGIILQVFLILPMFIHKLIKAKEYKLMALFLSFVTIVLLDKIVEYSEISNPWSDLFFAVIICIIGIYLCINLIKTAKLKNEYTYIPFGPSMLISLFIVVFWGEVILSRINFLKIFI